MIKKGSSVIAQRRRMAREPTECSSACKIDHHTSGIKFYRIQNNYKELLALAPGSKRSRQWLELDGPGARAAPPAIGA